MKPTATRHRQHSRTERGIALIMTSIVLIPLMFFAAFGVDLASWYARISEIQRAADAAALAGAVWMPNFGKAQTEAQDSLRSNGIVHLQDDMVVVIERGATPTSLRVSVTDTNATRFFSDVVMDGPASFTRHAEAQYNLPLPLGSPLNYFGGDAAKTQPAQVIDWSVVWPLDYTTRVPSNPSCDVGTASGQGLGRWAGSPPTYRPSEFGGSSRCVWTAGRADATGTSDVPPPDFRTRVPNNGTGTGCRVRSGTTTYGIWTGDPAVFAVTSTSSLPNCVWNNSTTAGPIDDGGTPPAWQRIAPSNRPCRVGYTTAEGWWPSSGAWSTTGVPTDPGQSGYVLCQWSALLSSVDNTPPNPIDASRSPGFWAQIHGPGANQESGDAYSPRCIGSTNCSTTNNPLYVPASDPNQGYWYVVTIPPGGGGQTTIRIFDAQITPGGLNVGTGDSSITGTASFATTYQVYRQTNRLDFNSRTPVTTGTANQTPNSCNWNINQDNSGSTAAAADAAFRLRWVDLCTFNASPNEIYLINVRSATNGASNSAGRNGYAVEACRSTGCTGGVQPSVYAYERMVLYNNVEAGSGTFYIAEVAPQYAGKTLLLEMFDPGEASGQAWVYAMMPSASQPRPVVNVPGSQCDVESTRTGYPRASDLNNLGYCSYRSADGSSLYNGHWVTMRIDIPESYTCTPGVDPEVTSGSCWWGINYVFDGSATDTTTWRARIEGNPLQLTE